MRQPLKHLPFFYLFTVCNTLQDFHHPLLNLSGGVMPVGEPNESHKHLLIAGHRLPQQLFMVTVGLANLSLHTVSVDSVFKAFLRYTDQDLCRTMVAVSPNGLIDSSKREGRDRLAAAVFKERLHQQMACHALPFSERRSRCHHTNLVSLPDNAEGLPSSRDISPTVPRCPHGGLPPWRTWP